VAANALPSRDQFVGLVLESTWKGGWRSNPAQAQTGWAPASLAQSVQWRCAV